MKAEEYKFPVLKESDAMFSADTAPEWAEGDCCHRCRVQFSLVQRKVTLQRLNATLETFTVTGFVCLLRIDAWVIKLPKYCNQKIYCTSLWNGKDCGLG